MQNSRNEIIEFTLLFNRYKKKIFNYVLKMISDRMAAEDIVQNVFLKLYENMDDIKNRSSINFWLFSTARNEVYSFYRKKKIRVDMFNVDDTEELEIDSGFDVSLHFELKETGEIIKKELEKISPDQKEIFIMKEYGGLSYNEIASLMEIDENLVKSRLYKTRQKLISRLSKLVK